MDVEDENESGSIDVEPNGINSTKGQVFEGEAEATQPLAENERVGDNQPTTSNPRHEGDAKTTVPAAYARRLRQTSLVNNEYSTNALWGDDPNTPTNGCRILFQNVNGISKYNDFGDAHEIGFAAEQLQVGILGLAETNLDWQARETKNNVRSRLKRYWKNSVMSFASSDYRLESEFQPGGTMIVVGQPWSGRASVAADTRGLGRWSEATLMGKENRKLTIICAYQVIKNSISTCGPSTVFAQQWHLLRLAGKTDPEPHLESLKDLGERVDETVGEDGHEVVLLIDANDSLQRPNSKLTRWVRARRLIDVHVRRHGTDEEPPTFARGTKRIDYILTSEGIANFVTAAGILPLHDFVTSDHRAIFADIAIQEFLRGEPNPLETASCRALISSDPRAVRKYRQLLEEYLDNGLIEHNLERAVIRLREEGLKEENASEIDRLDQEITQARLEFERKCSKVASYPWSPMMLKAKKIVGYWKLWVSELRIKRDLAVQRRKLNLDLDDKTIPLLSEAKHNLISAQRNLKETLKKAKELRESHLRERAEMAGTIGEPKIEAAIRRIIKAERMKDTFARLRRIMKNDISGGLSFLQIQESENRVRNVYDQSEINDLLIERNAKHFSQADGTPFTTSELKERFGRYGTNEQSNNLLDGNFDASSIDSTEAVKTLLMEMKRVAPEGDVSAEITANDVRNGYRKWRESTSTSPSGLHLGHEKALFKYEDESDKGRLSERMFRMKATLLNIAIRYGLVYSRWTTVVNAMIEKIPGRPLLHKLRVIHLIESDFNLMTGIIWGRRLMAQGERLDSFGEEQGGSRKDRRAQEILLFKHMVYSVVRLTKTNCTSFDNDAKSCYDRIVMLFASLSSQRLGLDPKACELFLRVLDKAKYHVKTKLGISQEYYATTDEATIHGPGQGGRSSPCIWTIISCLLIKCMKKKTDGASFHDPKLEVEVSRTCSGFVDDVTHLVNSFSESLRNDDSLQELASKTNVTAQWWEELLNATGGKLELQKCFFYMIFWEFDNEGIARMTKSDERPCEVKIRDSETGKSVNIEQKECDAAHKTLGAMETPSGDYSAEVKRLVDKAKTIAQKISTATVNNNEAHIIYRSMYLPGINYSFPAGVLNMRESEKVQGAPIQAILSAMGYNSNMPREVVFGPPESGGIGLRHLFAEQGSIKVNTIIQQIRADRSLGKMLQIQLRWAQRVAGITRPILEDTITPLPQLNDEKWLTTLREFLSESELGIRIKGIQGPVMKRAHDRAIMDVALEFGIVDEEVRMINRCRLFLRAECLSDICNAAGTNILCNAIKCLECAQLQSTEAWPRQPRPGKRHRKVWKVFLQSLCNDASQALRRELGNWTVQPVQRSWEAYYDPEFEIAAVQETNGKWTAREISGKTRRGLKLGHPTTSIDIDFRSSIPADVIARSSLGVTQIAVPLAVPDSVRPTEKEPLTWHQYVQTLPTWSRSLLEATVESNSAIGLWSALGNDSAVLYAVSDGGTIGSVGAYGWVIGTANEILYEGTGAARGHPMSSFRSEAYGKLSLMLFLRHYTSFMGIDIKGKIKYFCDNTSVIKQSRSDKKLTAREAMTADFDVIWQIIEEQSLLQKVTKQKIREAHVRGHQERITKKTELSRQAQLNIRADTIASQTLRQMMNEGEDVEMLELPQCAAYLINAGTIQTSQELSTSRWKWSDFRIQNYHCARLGVGNKTIHRINWEAFRSARRGLDTTEQAFATKMMTRWLPTGHQVQKYGGQVTACHRCGEDETVDHLFQCNRNGEWKEKFLDRLDEYLAEIETAADIRQAITSGITRWLDEDLMTKKHRCPLTMRTIYSMQSEIGWNLTMCGLFDENWSVYQNAANEGDQIFRKPGKKGKDWSTKLSRWMIREARQLWLDRNHEVHSSNDENRMTKSELDTLEQVRNLYKLSDDMSHHDRVMFNQPLEKRLELPITTLRQWVKNTIPTANRCIRDFKQKLKDRQSDIRRFFRSSESAQEQVEAQAPQMDINNNTSG